MTKNDFAITPTRLCVRAAPTQNDYKNIMSPAHERAGDYNVPTVYAHWSRTLREAQPKNIVCHPIEVGVGKRLVRY